MTIDQIQDEIHQMDHFGSPEKAALWQSQLNMFGEDAFFKCYVTGCLCCYAEEDQK